MTANIKAIVMPKWGMEMAEGDIASWHVAVGDTINVEDELVDVETSKIVNVVTSTAAGVLRAIVAQPGETHKVGAMLGVVADADVSDADIEAFIAANAGASAAAPAAEAPAAAPAAAETAPVAATPAASSSASLGALQEGDDDSDVPASPVARRLAADYGVNLNNITGTGRHGRVSKHDLETAIKAAGGQLKGQAAGKAHQPVLGDDSHIKATPVARRLAKDLGVNLNECRISGSRGRVSKADVEAVAARRDLLNAPTTVVTTVVETPNEVTAMTGMRKTIASRLQSSKQTAPHFRVQIDAELDALLAVRKQINAANSNAKVSVNDFIIKACACALQKVPAVNVQFDGENITQFQHADISVAVAIDDGLITPIVAKADTKGLVTISNEMRDLATRAKLGRLKAEEFQGGSFCVSNLGMFGIKQFDAIINPPQGAILAIGAGEQRAVVKNGQLAVATVATFNLSSDHRIIDGAVAAQFMAALKGFLEQPATMLG